MLKLIPPTAGTIAWNGADVTGLPEDALRPRRRDMQIIFQDPLASLDPRMTVAQIIGRPLRTFHPELKRAEVAARVNEAMRQVGLSPALAHRYPHEFSGGQCQRIGIARAIILRPKLIVCDEPVSALDVSIQAQIVNLLMRLRREMGMALIFISHNMSVVRHISDRVMVLYLGREAEIAGRDAFFARPLHPMPRRCCPPCRCPTRCGRGSAGGWCCRATRRRRSTRPPAAPSAPAARMPSTSVHGPCRRCAISALGTAPPATGSRSWPASRPDRAAPAMRPAPYLDRPPLE